MRCCATGARRPGLRTNSENCRRRKNRTFSTSSTRCELQVSDRVNSFLETSCAPKGVPVPSPSHVQGNVGGAVDAVGLLACRSSPAQFGQQFIECELKFCESIELCFRSFYYGPGAH